MNKIAVVTVVVAALAACGPSSQISQTDIDKWNSVYVAEFNDAGEVTHEVDPVFAATPAATITAANVTDWSSAAGWGNHGSAGYLKTEADPVFAASAAAGITAAGIANWNAASAWGDHADAGYLKVETEPAFRASEAFGITSAQLANWSMAFAWGNHATAGYLRAETDPAFLASAASAITAGNVTTWTTAAAWGNHADGGYLKTELDPVFVASPAHGITATNLTNWGSAFGWGNHAAAGYLTAELDPKVGALSPNAVGHWNGSALADGLLFDTGAGVGIGTATPTGEFEVYSTGQGVLDQQLSVTPNGAGSTDQWQSFTPSLSGKLTQIDLKVSSPIAPASSPGTLRIYVGEGTAGTLLSTTSVTFAAVNGAFQSFQLAQPPTVVAGQQYTVRFSAPAISVGWVYLSPTDAYAGGRANIAGWDYGFKAYVASSVSTLKVRNGAVNVQTLIHLQPVTSAPTAPTEGDVYFNGTTHRLNYYDGTTWVSL